MAAREMGGLSLADALSLCELLANADPARYDAQRCAGCSGSLTSGCRHSARLRSLPPPLLSFGTATATLASRRSSASYVTASPVSIPRSRASRPPLQHVKNDERDDGEKHHTEYWARPDQYKCAEGEGRDREHGQNHPSLPTPQLLLLAPLGPCCPVLLVRPTGALARQDDHQSQQTDVAEDSQSSERPGQPGMARPNPPPPSEVMDRPCGCQHGSRQRSDRPPTRLALQGVGHPR